MSNDILTNEKELVSLIIKGDESAFTKLFEFHKDRIYSVAFKLTNSSSTAEEIVQDVFLKIWIKRADLTDIQNISAYLFIVTRNEVYRVLKQIAKTYKRDFVTHRYPAQAENYTENFIFEKENNLVLQNAIQRLPNQQKQVYHLIKDQGLKRDEVAHLLHLQPETVKFHLAQAMKNIRTFCLHHLNLLVCFICFVVGSTGK